MLLFESFSSYRSPSARDAILLRTVYKSPTALHIFAFSIDDSALFPSIPPPSSTAANNSSASSQSVSVPQTYVRAQVDLQGISDSQVEFFAYSILIRVCH